MFGKVLKAAVKIGTAPLDIGDVGLDVLTGGDGSRRSRKNSLLSPLTEMRDNFANGLGELDDED